MNGQVEGKTRSNAATSPRGLLAPVARGDKQGHVRYAVVGLGHIAQVAMIPAFKRARENSVLAAIVSDDPVKRDVIARECGVGHVYGYGQFRECVRSGHVDAVYIATPNSEHAMFAREAARAGVHVLCEKQLAVTPDGCRVVIRECAHAGVLLMTAYRLHFEGANLRAVETARSGRLGELRAFSSVFTMQVRDEGNIRLNASLGGGPLHDIGIYCINAARSLFRDEPIEVWAQAFNSGDRRFSSVDETVACLLRFSGGRVASFVCSFGASDCSSFDLVGTKGRLRLDPAYEYAEGLVYREVIDERERAYKAGKHNQFAAELVYFSDCVLNDKKPEPSGEEGLADVLVIDALLHSIERGQPVQLLEKPFAEHPKPSQRIDRRASAKPRGVRVTSPGGERD